MSIKKYFFLIAIAVWGRLTWSGLARGEGEEEFEAGGLAVAGVDFAAVEENGVLDDAET